MHTKAFIALPVVLRSVLLDGGSRHGGGRMIDLHMHLLPGLDDGPSTLADAVAMGRMAAEDGTTVIVATPHMLDGMYDVQRDQILDGVKALQDILENEGFDLKLLPGADVHATADLPEQFNSGQVLSVANQGKYLMVELSQDVVPQGIENLFFSLQLAGITPIITHPERNTAVQDKPAIIFPLVHAGSLLQVTAASFTGRFGRTAERCARELLASDVVHFVASDAHDTKHRPPGLSRARTIVERAAGTDKATEIFERNPQCVLEGIEVNVSDPIKPDTSRTKRRWRWTRK